MDKILTVVLRMEKKIFMLVLKNFYTFSEKVLIKK